MKSQFHAVIHDLFELVARARIVRSSRRSVKVTDWCSERNLTMKAAARLLQNEDTVNFIVYLYWRAQCSDRGEIARECRTIAYIKGGGATNGNVCR